MDNMVEVSRTCHVMWHFANWQLWGNKEDYIAYRGLAGSISTMEINKELTALATSKQREKGVGIFGLTPEERAEYGSRGGKSGGKQMANYKWITNGRKNSRIPKNMEIPEGWRMGVTRKKPKVHQPKHGKREDYVKVQKEQSAILSSSRLKDLDSIDLTKWGAITRLSELWGISRAQVKRYLKKLGV